MKPDFKLLRFRRRSLPYQKQYTWQARGLDTETEKGYARVIADDESFIAVDSVNDCLEFMTRDRFLRHHNFFYNLHYDVECIFKHVRKEAAELFVSGDVEFDGYYITYLPKKLLTISKGSKKKFYYTDVAQFYRMPLAAAGEKYLGKKPHELKGSRATLFKDHSIADIGAYCVDDAHTTMLLGDLFLQKLNILGLQPKTCISAGNLAQVYTLQNASVPHVRDIPRNILKAYYAAYRGGWFDVYKKGRFQGYDYDLNSAYPAIMRELPDLRKGRWHPELRERAGLGCVRVSCRSRGKDFLPLAVAAESTLLYPYFDTKRSLWLTLHEFETLKNWYDFEIERVYSFVPDADCGRPYRQIVDTLFSYKQSSKTDAQQYAVAKILINSLYGKTFEKIPRPDGTFQAGKLFNPVYAAEITSRVRMRIFKDFFKHRDTIISLNTDGVITDSPVKIATGAGMGEWSIKHQDHDLVVAKNGIYQFAGERPVRRGIGNNVDLFKVFDQPGQAITLKIVRPQHVKECLIQDRFEDIGTFEGRELKLQLHDIRRLWKTEPSHFKDLLSNRYDSCPVPYSAVK